MNQTQLVITSFDKTPLVQVLLWIFLTISFLGVIARVATKLVLLRKVDLEDYLICIALVFALGQSIAVAIQCSNGFGQHLDTLSMESERAMLKAEYAASILFLASLCFSKISIVSFMIELTPMPKFKRASYYLRLLIIAWTISSIFAACFQCGLKRPWDFINNSCFNHLHFWNSVAAINIATDFAMICMITSIILYIRTSWSKRITIIGVFSTRILVIAAVGCQLFYANQPIKDPAFDLWPVSICTQAVQCLSIITACFPYLKPFLASLESGLMRADDIRRRGETSLTYYGNSDIHKLDLSESTQSKSKKSKFGRVLNKLISISQPESGDHELSAITATSTKLRPDQHTVIVIEGEGLGWDGQSQSSQSRIIRETRTWNVDVQNSGVTEITPA